MPPWRITSTAADRRGIRAKTRRSSARASRVITVSSVLGRRAPVLDQKLTLVPTPLRPEYVERRVHRRDPHPSGGLLVVAGEASVGRQEHLLRDVLRPLEVADDTLGEAHDDPVVVAEERFEASRRRFANHAFRALVTSRLQLHHTYSAPPWP